MTPEEQAHAAALDSAAPAPELRRRLSWLRVGGVVLLVAAVAAAIVGFRTEGHGSRATLPTSSFAPYVDVTATPTYAFEDPTQTKASNVTLGFVVAAPGASCQPSWGGAYSLGAAGSGLDLDRRIARLEQRGGTATVSFGGQANSELALACTDPTKLATAYASVVDRYHVRSVDLDIEGDAASAPAVAARRAIAIATVQQAHHGLAVWLTLPVGPGGLTATGRGVLDATLAAHVALAGVNALTMDYGQPLAAGQTMGQLAESSLDALRGQLITAYASAGTRLTDEQAWQRIGATPMIGQNDTVSERFELTDAHALLAFAQSHHLRQLAMWSLNRDQACGPNYANVEVVSPNCSGVNQQAGAYTAIFQPFTSGSAPAADPTPAGTATPSPAPTGADNPATSPYPIWNPAASYPAGSKVTWHHNVYIAKWYTSGDTPDAPIANASDTPWTLIGPVLPGEHPAPTPTLPAGTYPVWSAGKVYVAGTRVLYQGVGYQAKWWTQGDVPGVAVLTPSDTPWAPIAASK